MLKGVKFGYFMEGKLFDVVMQAFQRFTAAESPCVHSSKNLYIAYQPSVCDNVSVGMNGNAYITGVKIMRATKAIYALQYEKRYTFADYLKWDTNARYEFVDGIPYAMSAPSPRHEYIKSEISAQLRNFLVGKPCRVYGSTAVRLNADSYDDTHFEPDIVVVCDKSKVRMDSIVGAPDLVVEITSPSTSRRDRGVKFNRYQESGVREYWIVNPEDESVQVHILRDGKYDMAFYADEEAVPVHIFENFVIELGSVFEDQ